MKSAFQLLLFPHRNNHDPERTTTPRARTNRASNKIKSLSLGGKGGGGGGDSQSSSTTPSGARREGRHKQQGSTRGKSSGSPYYKDRHGGRDRHHHSEHQPKSFRNSHNTNNDMVWAANQSVNSLHDTDHAQSTECSTATGKGRSSSSRRMVVRRVQGRNDELAATCLAVGATVDTCMNEENGYLLADAIAVYACGYDDDDDDDDFDDDDGIYEQRDDNPTVYQSIYEFVQGIAGSKKQTPPHSSDSVKDVQQEQPRTPLEVPAQDEAKQVPQQAAPSQEVPQAEIGLRTATTDVWNDVVSLPDHIHRVVFPKEDNNSVGKRQESTDRNSQSVESHTIKDSDEGRDASDDSMGTRTQTSSHDGQQQEQRQLALHDGELNFFQDLFQALSHVTCQEPEWPLDHQSLQSDAIPANGVNPPEQNESSRQASVATNQKQKLKEEVSSSTMAPTGKPDKPEKKAIFPRRGRFGRGSGRTKHDQKVEPKTPPLPCEMVNSRTKLDKNNVDPKTPALPCEMVNNSIEQNSIHLEPRKIKRASSAIVTALVTTIEESASC